MLGILKLNVKSLLRGAAGSCRTPDLFYDTFAGKIWPSYWRRQVVWGLWIIVLVV